MEMPIDVYKRQGEARFRVVDADDGAARPFLNFCLAEWE